MLDTVLFRSHTFSVLSLSRLNHLVSDTIRLIILSITWLPVFLPLSNQTRFHFTHRLREMASFIVSA